MRVSLSFTQPLWDKAVICGGGTRKGEGTELSSWAGFTPPGYFFREALLCSRTKNMRNWRHARRVVRLIRPPS